MKFAYIFLFTLIGLKANAQNVNVFIKATDQHKARLISQASFTSSLNGAAFAFIKTNGRSTFDVVYILDTLKKDSLSGLRTVDFPAAAVVLKLDNDSSIYLHPNQYSRFNNFKDGLRLTIQIDITDDLLFDLRRHMVTSLTILTNTYQTYHLFEFTAQNEIDIQQARLGS